LRIYKFLEAKWAVRAVRDRRLKISLIPELNDPWEGRAWIHSSKEIEDIFDSRLYSASILLGISCFSKSWKNPVLWSHYCARHTGIVLGFEVQKPNDTQEADFFDVVYVDERKEIEISETAGLEEINKKVIDAFLFKFSHWSYESEVRSFVRLRKPDKETGHFFDNFEPDLKLTEVIFGMKHNNFSEVAEIVAVCREYNNIEIRKSAMSPNKFEMYDEYQKFQKDYEKANVQF
jgi:hypothetical protein